MHLAVNFCTLIQFTIHCIEPSSKCVITSPFINQNTYCALIDFSFMFKCSTGMHSDREQIDFFQSNAPPPPLVMNEGREARYWFD